MRERPIPFSTPMVRAILAGTKTQTRRVLREQPMLDRMPHCMTSPDDRGWVRNDDGITWRYDGLKDGRQLPYCGPYKCPYGDVGDRLWVREAWKTHSLFNDLPPRDLSKGSRIFYLAGGYSPDAARYRHARFMPRWASRTLLEVEAVRVERLQAISEADAIAEGLRFRPALDAWSAGDDNWPTFTDPRRSYAGLWDAINGVNAWNANPWVWVVSFRRLQ